MKLIIFILPVFLLPTFLCATLQISNEELWKKEGTICENGTLSPNEFLTLRIQSCISLYGPGKENPDCIFSCFEKAFGFLNENGISTWDIYQKWIAIVIPLEHREMFTNWVKDCWDKFGSKIDRQDATCSMGNQFSQCVWGIKPHLKC